MSDGVLRFGDIIDEYIFEGLEFIDETGALGVSGGKVKIAWVRRFDVKGVAEQDITVAMHGVNSVTFIKGRSQFADLLLTAATQRRIGVRIKEQASSIMADLLNGRIKRLGDKGRTHKTPELIGTGDVSRTQYDRFKERAHTNVMHFLSDNGYALCANYETTNITSSFVEVTCPRCLAAIEGTRTGTEVHGGLITPHRVKVEPKDIFTHWMTGTGIACGHKRPQSCSTAKDTVTCPDCREVIKISQGLGRPAAVCADDRVHYLQGDDAACNRRNVKRMSSLISSVTCEDCIDFEREHRPIERPKAEALMTGKGTARKP